MWCSLGISIWASFFPFIYKQPSKCFLASANCLFADDTNLYYDSETLHGVIKKVNKGILPHISIKIGKKLFLG